MMLFGTGLAFFFGKPYVQPSAPHLPTIPLGFWSDMPQMQAARCEVNPLFLIGIALALALCVGVPQHARRPDRAHGRRQRRRGARHGATTSTRMRLCATATGSALAGIGGAFLSLVLSGQLERGPVLRPGPDGGRARHLRALEPDRLHLAPRCCSAPPARSGPSLQTVGVTQGYYLFYAAPYVLTLVRS